MKGFMCRQRDSRDAFFLRSIFFCTNYYVTLYFLIRQRHNPQKRLFLILGLDSSTTMTGSRYPFYSSTAHPKFTIFQERVWNLYLSCIAQNYQKKAEEARFFHQHNLFSSDRRKIKFLLQQVPPLSSCLIVRLILMSMEVSLHLKTYSNLHATCCTNEINDI